MARPARTHPESSPMRFLPRAAAILLPIVALLGCAKPPAARPESPPAPVTVATAVKKTVPVRVRSIGTVKVLATVSVRPRAGGELTAVHFREGEYVAKGQKLFTIDPRPYEATLKQAEANMARNKAVLAGAELDLKRIERVSASGVASFAD